MSIVDESYSALLDQESKAAIYLARSNRSLQAVRAAIGDLMMSRTAELNERAENDAAAAETSFVKYMDTAIAALPERSEIAQLKAEGL